MLSQGCSNPFVEVGQHEVEVELVRLRFGEELAATAEGFQVELVFLKPVHGLHVTLVGVRGGRGSAEGSPTL